MTSPAKVFCKDGLSPTIFQPTYDVGATAFEISSNPGWVSINATTGALTIITDDPSAGVYRVTISYTISSVDYSKGFSIIVKNCYGLNKISWQICKSWTSFEDSLAVADYDSGSYSKTTTSSFFMLNSDGTFTIDTSLVPTGVNIVGISYVVNEFTKTAEITVEKVDCPTSDLSNYIDCYFVTVLLVWLNNLGGWENYYFNQDKTYSIDQKGAKSFVGSDRGERYSSRGKVFDVVEVDNQLIPTEHVDKIRSLRDSVQAFITTDVSDPTKAIPIKITEGSFRLYDLLEQTHSLSFTFKYAKNKLIQGQ